MNLATLLKADAAINLVLGILLVSFPAGLVKVLGIPMAESSFYPAILGGVIFGIGVTLLIECYRKSGRFVGLGLGGAVAINLCGGFVLAVWLLSDQSALLPRGRILLWFLVLLLVGISLLEGLAHLKTGKRNKQP